MYNPRPGDKNILSEIADLAGNGIKAMDEYVWTPAADATAKAAETVGNHMADAAAEAIAEKANQAIETAITKGLEHVFGSSDQESSDQRDSGAGE